MGCWALNIVIVPFISSFTGWYRPSWSEWRGSSVMSFYWNWILSFYWKGVLSFFFISSKSPARPALRWSSSWAATVRPRPTSRGPRWTTWTVRRWPRLPSTWPAPGKRSTFTTSTSGSRTNPFIIPSSSSHSNSHIRIRHSTKLKVRALPAGPAARTTLAPKTSSVCRSSTVSRLWLVSLN